MTPRPEEPEERQRIVRALHHEERSKPFASPAGVPHRDEITAHVERHFGKVANVFHEVISDLVHLDVLIVEPTPDNPWYVLVTSGMSDLPMRVTSGENASRHAELVMFALPPVPFDTESIRDDAVHWPIRHLKQLARMPHELDTWLAVDQTIATKPPAPVAEGSAFCAFAVLDLLDADARRLATPDGTEIAFLQLVPMYREELEWRLAATEPHALRDLFDSNELRVAAPRPNLQGEEFDAMVAAATRRIVAGRRHVVAIAIVILALAVADAIACDADGARMPWARTGITFWLTFSMANGSRLARWVSVALLGVGAGFGARLLATAATADSWRMHVLLVSIPIWLVAAALLAFLPSIRAWFSAQQHAEA